MSTLLQSTIDRSIAALEAARVLEEPFQRAVAALSNALRGGKKVLCCGNGGSAADASHLATELLCRFINDRAPLPGINLAADGGFLTAAANDYGYDPVFARQVTGLGSEGDVLVAFTTSGNSANILLALEAAKERGVLSIAMLGRDGGKAKGVADIEIIVPHGETARIQEVHGLLIHALCLGIERDLFPGLNEA